LHATQAAPLEPHAPFAVPAWQFPLPSQQPTAQLAALQAHAPLTHSCPTAHWTHAAPFAPHSAFVAGFTQVVPAQHPDVQFEGPQYATHS